MPSIIIHGGAADRDLAAAPSAQQERWRRGLAAACTVGWNLLATGVPALDAAVAAVAALEADGAFNAGRGAVRNCEGDAELDAAVMDGGSGRAGAVAAVRRLRHPVHLARQVLEHGRHVLLSGPGAESFAIGQGIALDGPWSDPAAGDDAYGTVGAAVCDRAGRLAAATSTGGISGKLPGRIGDSPLIGCGTWADTRVAVSCTGDGEAFIRAAAAHDLAARVSYLGMDARAAADAVLQQVAHHDGRGGLIAVTQQGVIVRRHSSRCLLHAWQDAGGQGVALLA